MSTPAILLLHAFPLDAGMWASARRRLEEVGLGVVAPDLPPPGEARSLGEWAHFVLGVVDGPFVPVGISMGGYLAFELVRRAPERIAGLVLCDTRAGPDTLEARRGRVNTIRLIREGGAAALWGENAPKLFAGEPSPEAERIVRVQEPARLVAAVEAIRGRADSRRTLSTIAVPTLVVVGTEDSITPPEEAEAIAAAIPGASLTYIDGSGHLPPLERPEEFEAALLAFLEQFAA